jgi:phosphoglycerate dehydrogenase-like enzyme
VATLDRGILGGAILDVTTPEPLPPDSKLWHTQSLIITPHVSSDDDANYTDLALGLLYRTLGRYLEGRPLINMADEGAHKRWI